VKTLKPNHTARTQGAIHLEFIIPEGYKYMPQATLGGENWVDIHMKGFTEDGDEVDQWGYAAGRILLSMADSFRDYRVRLEKM